MAGYNLGSANGVIIITANTGGIQQVQGQLQGINQQSSSTGQAVDTLGTKMGIAGAAIAGGLALGVKTAADFQQVLSEVGAVSGATAGQMQKMHDKALQIGKDTAFGATEAAQAMSELAKAGLSVDDILGGAADATVALAAAGGVDMPTAATIASNAMNQFGLTAKDMTNTVDLIAGAANASAIDVSDLGMSMSQAGAVAHLAGLSFDDTAVAIAEMGNAGIKGSDAGTSLKSMLGRLQPTTKAATTAMSELGLITKDGTNLFYDQTGKLKPLKDIQELLHNSTKDLSAAEKQMALQTIFGTDAIRAAAVMSGEGAAGFDKMNAAMRETSAADVAKTRMDNMKGSLENMSGSLETAAIAVGETLIPKLTQLFDWLGNLFDKFNTLSPAVKDTITWVLVGVSGFLLFTSAAIKVYKSVSETVKAVITVGKALGGLTASTARAIWSFTTTATSAVVNGAKTAASWVAAAARTVASWVMMAARAAISAAATAAAWAAGVARSIGSFALMSARAAASAAATAAAWAAAAAKTVAQWVLMGARAAAQAAIVAGAWLISNGAAIATSLAAMAVAVATTLAGWISMAASAVAGAAIIALQWIIAFWPVALIIAILIAVIAAVIIFWDDIVAAFKTAAAWVSNLMQTIWAAIQQAWDWIVQKFQEAWALIVSIFQAIWDAIQAAWNSIVQAFQAAGQAIWDALKQAWQWVQDVWNTIINFFRQIPGWIAGIFSSALSWLINAGRNIISGLWNGVKAMWNGFWGWIGNIGSWIINALSNAGSWLLDTGRRLIEGLWNGIKNAAGWLWDKIKGWAKGLVNSILGFFGIGSPSKLFRDEIGKWLPEGLAVGITANADSAIKAAQAMSEAVSGSVALSAGVPGTFWDGTSIGVGNVPVSPEVASYAASQAAAADRGPGTTITTNIYNPVAEAASDSEARRLRTLSALGAF